MKQEKTQRGKALSHRRHLSQGKHELLGVSQFGPASHSTAPDSRWKETCTAPTATTV